MIRLYGLVHTSNANARKVRYAGAVEVFFQDGGQGWPWWHGTCVFLPCVCICVCVAPVHMCEMQTQAQMQVQESEHFSISCVGSCVCTCVTIVHTCIFLRLHPHLHLRLHLHEPALSVVFLFIFSSIFSPTFVVFVKDSLIIFYGFLIEKLWHSSNTRKLNRMYGVFDINFIFTNITELSRDSV